MEGFSSYSERAAEISPELLSVVEAFEILRRINELLSWLIEAGPGVDPVIKAARQAILDGMLRLIGIDPDDENKYHLLIEFDNFVRESARALDFSLEAYDHA